MWDAATGNCLRIFEGHEDYVGGVALSPDGRVALSGGGDSSLRYWDISTGKCQRSISAQRNEQGDTIISIISFAPDWLYALVVAAYDFWLLDVTKGVRAREFTGYFGQVKSVAWSADGRFALSGIDDSCAPPSFRLWDVNTGECLRTFEGQYAFSVAFSPDGRFAVSGGKETIQLWEFDWNYVYDPECDPVLKRKMKI